MAGIRMHSWVALLLAFLSCTMSFAQSKIIRYPERFILTFDTVQYFLDTASFNKYVFVDPQITGTGILHGSHTLELNLYEPSITGMNLREFSVCDLPYTELTGVVIEMDPPWVMQALHFTCEEGWVLSVLIEFDDGVKDGPVELTCYHGTEEGREGFIAHAMLHIAPMAISPGAR